MNTRDVIRAELYSSFELFTRYFFKERQKRKFILGEHHKIIIDALERVQKGKCKRLIINIAPRYGKTELAVKNFIAHSLAINPKAKFIHLSYSDQLALDNSEEVKDLICSDEYQELFPYVKIKADSRAKNKWYTTQGGGVLARSSSGQVTGFGAGNVDDEDEEFLNSKFGGAIIIDDPIKPDDADSETLRNKVNQKFDTTIRNRVNSRNTPIIVIMQRLNELDLCGYLIDKEPDEWEVISLPCIKDDGTALWEFKHTIDELEELKRINPWVFGTQYLQNPMPKEGLLFKRESLNLTDKVDLSKVEHYLAYIDVATSKGGDYHSCLIGAIIDKKLYIVDCVFTNEEAQINVLKTAGLLNKYNPEFCRIESNGAGALYKHMLEPHVNVTQLLNVHSTQNKQTRIFQGSGWVKDNCVFFNNSTVGSEYHNFFRQFTTYLMDGSSKNDDAPDSVHGLSSMARSFYKDSFND